MGRYERITTLLTGLIQASTGIEIICHSAPHAYEY